MHDKPEIVIFDTLFEAVSEAVIIVDKSQKIKIANSSAEQMFGYNDGELIDESLENLIPKEHKKNHHTHFNSFLNSQEKRAMGKGRALHALNKSGLVFPVEVKLNPFELYGEKLTMALVVNITFQKNQELEIKKRIEAENNAKIALKKEQELNELKTKFLSLVSHQFKTPLTGISISSMLLAKYKLTEDQQKREKHISIINNKVHYLNKIINDFLSIEKLEKGEIKYNLTTFEIKDIVNNSINEVSSILKGGQRIVCNTNDEDILVYQDEKIIELTLANLLSNAIKYSRENGKITIDIEKNKENAIIKITDRGFGIPEKDQKHIFNRYFRAENVLLIEGTGIGLNIIKNHLTNLGGTITFKSKQNIGTTFVVTIPNKLFNEKDIIN